MSSAAPRDCDGDPLVLAGGCGLRGCRERDVSDPGGGAVLSSDAARRRGGRGAETVSQTTFEHVVLQGTRSCGVREEEGTVSHRDEEKLVSQI